MKVEVDMEKISAELAAAEEVARKRIAERDKDSGDKGAKGTPSCVLAEEDKHVCAAHGKKSQPNPQKLSSSKEGEDAESNGAETPGGSPLSHVTSCVQSGQVSVVCIDQMFSPDVSRCLVASTFYLFKR